MTALQRKAVSDYSTFLTSKRLVVQPVGPQVQAADVNPVLFPHQRDVATWAVRRGRAAVLLDAGLGKTLIMLEWARLLKVRALIIAPLSVARQTVAEAKRLLNLDVHYTRDGHDLADGINITNYEMAHHFNPDDFGAVVLDESSVLKSLDSKTRLALTTQWKNTPYRLACTATPAPNDLKEIVNHADWLGVMSRKEVFAAFFINETSKKRGKSFEPRLKHQAVGPFYEWMASWAIAAKKPSDLGYPDAGYELPPLTLIPHAIHSDYRPADQLFFTDLKGVVDRSRVQRATLETRVQSAAGLVNSGPGQWIVWHHLNDEGRALLKAIPGAVLVEGATKDKADAYEAFIDGKYRVLITKPSIAGFGMNFQNAANQCFAGITDSFEEFYQAVRRSYRFGQQQPVNVHVVYADVQEAVYENVTGKERKADEMSARLIAQMQSYNRAELTGQQRGEDYAIAEAQGHDWQMLLGDSVERLKEIETDSVGLGIHSPPFVNRYAYTPTERDLGNSRDLREFMAHYRYIIRELLRVTMPGRNQCIHVQQVRVTKRDTGNIGMIDFRGAVIRAFIKEGFIYSGERTIDKDAQIQARRKHNVGLMFKTLNSDSSKLSGALADYLLIFKKPGDNLVPIKSDVTEKEWIRLARPVWYHIDEIRVLPSQQRKADDEDAHLCPLQLDFIEHCVRLWSNKGDVVLDPFAGVGSVPYVAIEKGRRGIGIELKPNYFRTATANLRQAEYQARPMDMFSLAELGELAAI